MYTNEDTTSANIYMSIEKTSNGNHVETLPNGNQVPIQTTSYNHMLPNNNNSVCSSPTAEDALLLNHDYADPNELKDSIQIEMKKIDRQKRQNLIYEPVTTKRGVKNRKNDKNNNSNGGDGHNVCRCTKQTWCLFFVFVVSSCSLGLCLLITFGILDTKGDNRQDEPSKRPISSTGKLFVSGQENMIQDLKGNITLLSKQIPSFIVKLDALQDQLKHLSSKTSSITTSRAPKVRTTAVRRRLSKCRYKQETSIRKYDDVPEHTVVKTPWFDGDEGYELVGASCSTIGGLQHGLFVQERREKRYYQCRCAGKAVTEAFKSRTDEMLCTMHFWECPI